MSETDFTEVSKKIDDISKSLDEFAKLIKLASAIEEQEVKDDLAFIERCPSVRQNALAALENYCNDTTHSTPAITISMPLFKLCELRRVCEVMEKKGYAVKWDEPQLKRGNYVQNRTITISR